MCVYYIITGAENVNPEHPQPLLVLILFGVVARLEARAILVHNSKS